MASPILTRRRDGIGSALISTSQANAATSTRTKTRKIPATLAATHDQHAFNPDILYRAHQTARADIHYLGRHKSPISLHHDLQLFRPIAARERRADIARREDRTEPAADQKPSGPTQQRGKRG